VLNEACDFDTVALEVVLVAEGAALVPLDVTAPAVADDAVFCGLLEITPVVARPVPVNVTIEPLVVIAPNPEVSDDRSEIYALEAASQKDLSRVIVVIALPDSVIVCVAVCVGNGQVVANLLVGSVVAVVVSDPSKHCRSAREASSRRVLIPTVAARQLDSITRSLSVAIPQYAKQPSSDSNVFEAPQHVLSAILMGVLVFKSGIAHTLKGRSFVKLSIDGQDMMPVF
jgi:hypothetical protein